jgi:aminopeptidase-like protein
MSSHSGFFPIIHKNIEVILHTYACPPSLEHNNCNLMVQQSTFALLIAIADGWNVVVPH